MSLDPQLTAFLDQERAHLAAVLREHRWAVQWVGPGEERGQPPFACTIGPFGLGHPELVVSGVGAAVAHGMLAGRRRSSSPPGGQGRPGAWCA